MSAKADRLLLGIDVGTSLIKVGVFDLRGKLRAILRRPQEVRRLKPGWAEMDPRHWWRTICRGVKELLQENAIKAREVASIGISGLCPAAMLLGRQGEPITPAIIHQDRRSQGIRQRLPSELIETAARITGNPVLPGTASALNLLWFEKHADVPLTGDVVFAHANTYLGMKLTGALGIDGSQAALSGLMAFRTGGWSEELCAISDIDADRFPPLLPASVKLGALATDAAESLGLRSGIPVAIGGADTACAALGLGEGTPGHAFLRSGTTDVLGTVVSPAVADPQLILRPHVVANAWLLLGVVTSAGASLQWAKDVLKLKPGDMVPTEWSVDAPLFLPRLAGERTGAATPAPAAALIGFGLETTTSDLWAAVLEGAAMGLRQMRELIELRIGRVLSVLRCAGGGTRDRRWLQVKADVLQRTLAVASQQEAALSGAALLGCAAAGIFGSEQEMLSTARQATDTSPVQPEAGRSEFYDRRYELFKQCPAQLKAAFSQLSTSDDPS